MFYNTLYAGHVLDASGDPLALYRLYGLDPVSQAMGYAKVAAKVQGMIDNPQGFGLSKTLGRQPLPPGVTPKMFVGD